MYRFIIFIGISLWGQVAVGQKSVTGKYTGSGMLLDSLRVSFQLSLLQDGSYKLKSLRKDSSMSESGTWRQKGDKVNLKAKYSKQERQYALQRTFVLLIEGDNLVWKPNFNKRKFEKEMTKTVGENFTLIDKSESLILYKDN